LLNDEVTADTAAVTSAALRFPELKTIGGIGGDGGGGSGGGSGGGGGLLSAPATAGAGGVAANALPVTLQPAVDWPLDSAASCVALSATG
jgi:hypothetical protein